MKGWMPMPAAIGIATSARIVDAVIHGTKKWRTKAIAATTRTKPSDDGRHLRLHRIDQPGVDVEGREDGLEAQDHAAVHEEPEGPPGLQGALVETPYHEEAEEGPHRQPAGAMPWRSRVMDPTMRAIRTAALQISAVVSGPSTAR